jgi:SAM-dependent methyltransferase
MEASLVPNATFDRYASDYDGIVDDAVGFSGKGLAFYTAAKAYHLRKLGARLGRSLDRAAALDVGCGAGGLDELLIPHVDRLVGVDVSPEMVKRARLLNPEADYQVYAGDKLPFGDQTFDLVFASCVVHHVDPSVWDAFVAEMYRVTRPGGAIAVIEHNPLNPLTRRSVSNCVFDEDAVLASPHRLARALRRAGAGKVRSSYILFAPFGGDRVRAAEGLLSWLPLGAQYVVEARR